MKLRGKLTFAFLAVWLPTAVGAALVFRALDRQIEARIEARLDDVVRQVESGVERKLAELDATVDRVRGDSARELNRWVATSTAAITSPLSLGARAADTAELLTVVDWALEPDGIVVYARHLPAARGFPAPDYATRTRASGFATVTVSGNPPPAVPALVHVEPLSAPGESAPRASVVAGTRLDAGWLETTARLARAHIGVRSGATEAPVWLGEPIAGGHVARRQVPLPGAISGRDGALELAIDYGPWAELRDTFARWSLGTLGSSAAIALVLGVLLARRIQRPVADLSRAAKRVADDDLEVRVSPRGRDEVADLARVFNDMVGELARNRQRVARAERLAAWREVARRVAHEVKNPLSPIRMAVENVRKAVRREHPDTAAIVERSTDTVLAEVAAIDRLVSEFSELARMPPPRFAPARWPELLAAVAARYDGVFPGVTIRVDCAVETPGNVDRDRMLRALSNLVKNAGEALGGRPGHIVLSARRAGNALEIAVEDDGPGLETSAAEAFSPYATTKREGTGLGLAIVERIALEHDGEVRHEPVAPHGARFVLGFRADDARRG